MTEPAGLSYDAFAPHLGETLEVAVPGGQPLRLELTEVVKRSEPGGADRLQFSVFFVGPATPVLPQAIYRLGHAGLGDLDLFLVPLGPVAGGMRYEAAFA